MRAGAAAPRARPIRRPWPAAGAFGALLALGLAAALPAVSKPPAAALDRAASTPQRVLADTPFPSAQQFVSNELAQLVADRTAPPGLFATLTAHRNDLLGYGGAMFALTPDAAPADPGLRAGDIDRTLADTLNHVDLPPEVRIQIGDLISGKVKMRAPAQPGDRYRIAFDTASGKPRVTAIELRVAGRAFGALWFKPPGDAQGAYYAFDGSPLEGAAFTMPVISTRISSYFGERIHPLSHLRQVHTGVDLAAPRGTRVNAAANGVVSFVGTDPGGYGKYVVVDHPGGYSTYYAHLSAFAPGLKTGQDLAQGQRLGSVGSTGAATGPHLHFEVRIADQPVDPLVTLAQAQNTLSGMQMTAFRHQLGETRLALASIAAQPLGFAQIDPPLWADFARDESTLRAIFNTHYTAS
nr:M23 family metallopeptidase [Burkholderia alba]